MKWSSKDNRQLFSEIVFLIASLLVFRSGWHLLDIYPLLDKPIVLVLSLGIGLAIAIPAMRVIIKNDK